MKVRTQNLTGPALDWAVAKADKTLYPSGSVHLQDGRVFTIERGDWDISDCWRLYSPSTEWAQGGPYIQRENIGLSALGCGDSWEAGIYDLLCSELYRVRALTALEAAMRCYVMSQLGDEIEIPEELNENPT